LTEINNIIKEFSSITLKEMDNVKLMNRIDTKFIINTNDLSSILEKAKDNYKVLKIDDKRNMTYRTIYFDTENFSMYLAHQNGKLNRYKIRTREYIMSNTKYLEIKLKSNKGKTIKKRIKIKPDQKKSQLISKKGKKFIKENSPFTYDELNPKLWINYSRMTLIHKKNKERITVDLNLTFKNHTNNKIDLPYLTIIEVKQEHFFYNSDFIQLLHQAKIQPTRISKYCTGTVLLNKNIKYNNFKNRLLTLNKLNYDNKYSYCFVR
jgi:hypothetical protein